MKLERTALLLQTALQPRADDADAVELNDGIFGGRGGKLANAGSHLGGLLPDVELEFLQRVTVAGVANLHVAARVEVVGLDAKHRPVEASGVRRGRGGWQCGKVLGDEC